MAKYLRVFWAVLALLMGVWMCSSVTRLSQIAEQVDAEMADEDSEAFTDLGIAVGSGLSLGIVALCMFPAFLFFLFMYWRNTVQIREDRKHQETIATIQAGQKGF